MRDQIKSAVAVADALRSIRYLKANAIKLNLIPDKIAILGFSAGGNLAGLAGTRYDVGVQNEEDYIDKISSRPDAVVQGYGSFSYTAFPDHPVMYNRCSKKELSDFT